MDNQPVDTSNPTEQLKQLLLGCALCNAASVVWSENTPYALDSEMHGVKAIGEPTEVRFIPLHSKIHDRIISFAYIDCLTSTSTQEWSKQSKLIAKRCARFA